MYPIGPAAVHMQVCVNGTHLSALYLDGAADSIVAAADGELPGPRGGDGHAAVAVAAARGAAAAAAAAVEVAPDVDPDHVNLVLVCKG